jgi:Tol biopolymer transport system component
LLAIGGALVAGLLLYSLRPVETRSFQRPEPLTSYPGLEILPAFSPEGDRVAFMWNGENHDNWDIYIKLVGQDGVQRLTNHPAADWSPAWSPDGKQIAFVRRDLDAGTSQLTVMPAIGGPERSILRSPLIRNISVWNQLGRLVAWHPDNEHLIVTHAQEAGQPFFLYAVSTRTGQVRRLTYSDTKIDGDMDPAVSADGRRLAFRRKIQGWNSDTYIGPLTPSLEAVKDPILVGRRMFSPAWTHDGREVVMVDSPTRPGLWRVSGHHDTPRRVQEPVEAAFPAVSPAGNRIAFSVVKVKLDIWQARLQGDPQAKPLIASTYLDLVPDFSPDGRRIAFASHRSGNAEIWVCNRDGSNAVQLTNHKSVEADCPSWSPDGLKIAYHANQDGYRDVFVIDANGGAPRRLTHREGLDVAPSWSRDGQWIYFTSERSGERCVWKIPLLGGEAVQVTAGSYAQESVDGKTLFVDDGRALWTMPVAGGRRSQLLPRSWANANFEVREQGIYLLGNRALSFYDFKSKAVRKVFATPEPTSWGLSVSPDGNTVLFAQRAREEADIMIMGEFR